MKKFTDLNNTENSNKVEHSKTKKELIGNIVEESLRIENGVIIGKDLLVETFNRMIEINDHKTAIQVLESVKTIAYNTGFNFNTINEAIENEKVLMNKPIELIVEKVEETKEVGMITESVDIINENVDSTPTANEIKSELEKKNLKGVLGKSLESNKVLEEGVDFVIALENMAWGIGTYVYLKNTTENVVIVKEIITNHGGGYTTANQGQVVGITNIGYKKVDESVVNESKVGSQLKKAAEKTGVKFSVSAKEIEKEYKDGNYTGGKTMKLIDEIQKSLSIIYDEVKEECKDGECEVKESVDTLNESAEYAELLKILLGTGGVLLSSVVITKLMISLEEGKFGEKGKKIAHSLSNMSSLLNSGKSIAPLKKDDIKESIFIENYTDDFSMELESLNSIYKSIRNTK